MHMPWHQWRRAFPVFLLSHLIPHRPTHFQGLSVAPRCLIVSLLFPFFFCRQAKGFPLHFHAPLCFYQGEPPNLRASSTPTFSRAGPATPHAARVTLPPIALVACARGCILSHLSVPFPRAVTECLPHLQQRPTDDSSSSSGSRCSGSSVCLCNRQLRKLRCRASSHCPSFVVPSLGCS